MRFPGWLAFGTIQICPGAFADWDIDSAAIGDETRDTVHKPVFLPYFLSLVDFYDE